jgi:hypothetical protein
VYCQVPEHSGPVVTVARCWAVSTPRRCSNEITCSPVGLPLHATATSPLNAVGDVAGGRAVGVTTGRREKLGLLKPDGDGGRAFGSRTGPFGASPHPASTAAHTATAATGLRIAPPDDARLHGAEERQ